MKTWMALLVCVAGLVLCGCGKKKQSPPPVLPPGPEVNKAMASQQAALDAAKKAAEEQAAKLKAQADAVQKDAEKRAAQVTAAVDAAKKAAEAKAMAAADEFKATVAGIEKLITGKDYTAATEAIQKAFNTPNLTAEQKGILEGLLAQVRKAVAATVGQDAKAKLGGALKGFGK